MSCRAECDWLLLSRDGCDWLFDELHKHGVPLLIFSAGIGDVVTETVRQRAVLHDNVKIVANFMDFDSQVCIIGCIWTQWSYLNWMIYVEGNWNGN